MQLTSWLKKNGVEPEVLTVNGALRMGIEGALPSLSQALPRLAHEVGRARRYERPYSIALVGTEDAHVPSLITLLMAAVVRESVREHDIVAYAPSLALCVIGMPETRQASARTAMARVQRVCFDRLLMAVRTGIAQFPVAGWTLEELIKQAEVDAMKETTASPPAAAGPLTTTTVNSVRA